MTGRGFWGRGRGLMEWILERVYRSGNSRWHNYFGHVLGEPSSLEYPDENLIEGSREYYSI